MNNDIFNKNIRKNIMLKISFEIKCNLFPFFASSIQKIYLYGHFQMALNIVELGYFYDISE